MIPFLGISTRAFLTTAVVAAIVVMVANKTEFGKQYLGGGTGWLGL